MKTFLAALGYIFLCLIASKVSVGIATMEYPKNKAEAFVNQYYLPVAFGYFVFFLLIWAMFKWGDIQSDALVSPYIN